MFQMFQIIYSLDLHTNSSASNSLCISAHTQQTYCWHLIHFAQFSCTEALLQVTHIGDFRILWSSTIDLIIWILHPFAEDRFLHYLAFDGWLRFGIALSSQVCSTFPHLLDQIFFTFGFALFCILSEKPFWSIHHLEFNCQNTSNMR